MHYLPGRTNLPALLHQCQRHQRLVLIWLYWCNVNRNKNSTTRLQTKLRSIEWKRAIHFSLSDSKTTWSSLTLTPSYGPTLDRSCYFFMIVDIYKYIGTAIKALNVVKHNDYDCWLASCTLHASREHTYWCVILALSDEARLDH